VPVATSLAARGMAFSPGPFRPNGGQK